MMHKPARKPVRRARYQNTLQTKSPGPPWGHHRHLTKAMHYLVDAHALAVWPWASYFTSLSLSVCKMGFKTIPTSQSCCEDQMMQCTERAEHRAWHLPSLE